MFVNIYSAVESSQSKTFIVAVVIYSCSRKSVKNDSLSNNHSKYLLEKLEYMTSKLATSGHKA